jgi:hypothetical protein
MIKSTKYQTKPLKKKSLLPIVCKTLILFSLAILIIGLNSCKEQLQFENSSTLVQDTNIVPFAYEGIHDLRRGDIIVKPNLNFLPGTSFMNNGIGFGHAALVVSGYNHENMDSLLAGTTIIESIAKDVPVEFQVREIRGLIKNKSKAFNNTNFKGRYKGNRYRLRLALTETQIDSIIAFAKAQKMDYSAWNATKSYRNDSTFSSTSQRKNWADNNTWYCSLLVWQSVYYVTNIDLDPNQGYMVYPNDLINSKFFDNTHENQGRVKF